VTFDGEKASVGQRKRKNDDFKLPAWAGNAKTTISDFRPGPEA
jgi:hypothetical protein